MAFTLDKNQGKGKATVKVTPEVNQTGNKVTGQILVQVNGITKQVVQLVQKAAVSQQDLEMHLTINNPYISGDGGTAIFSYWAVENEAIIGDNLELVFENKESADVPFILGAASKDYLGRVMQAITLPANNINEIKELKFHARHKTTGSISNTLTVSLLGKDMTVLPNFDFFCFSYGWEEEAGEDLDSATLVTGSKIPIGGETSGKTLDDYFVGHSGNGNNNTEVQQYLKFGGDNTQSGVEGAFINWREICNRDFISQGITKLYAYIYGNWYDTKGTGNMIFYLKTYKGTGMIQDGYEFKPDKNTKLITETYKVINCNAFSQDNDPENNLENMRKWYSLLATIEYDVATSRAVFKPNLQKSGRGITASVVFDGETINFSDYGSASKSINITDQPYTGSHNWSNARELVDIDPDTGSASNHAMYVEDEPTVSANWVDINFVKDGSGHITGMTYQISLNNTGSSRSVSISLEFKPSVRNAGANTLTLTITQAKLPINPAG